MQLVNMDVDRYATNDRCNLGPFSPGLNAICGPKGSGKSTLLSWLRHIAAEHDVAHSNYRSVDRGFGENLYDLPHASPSRRLPISGILEIANRGHRTRISSDRNGRIKFDTRQTFDSIPHRPLSPVQTRAFAGLAAATGAADTEASLRELATALRLDEGNVETHADRYDLLRTETRLKAELARLGSLAASQDELQSRRVALENELADCRRSPRATSHLARDNAHLLSRYDAIDLDLANALQEVERIEHEIAARRAELKLNETGHHELDVGESYRVQLKQLDDRLNRWRQTLRDLKAHRERIDQNATDVRLDQQIGDQLSHTKHADPRAALRSLEAQILSTKQQLDILVERSGMGIIRDAEGRIIEGREGSRYDSSRYSVHRDAQGRTRVAYTEEPTYSLNAGELPEMLRRMQLDMHEVCQQLARHEASAAANSLRQQIAQLQRCEAELLQSVEQLIEERSILLRKIADEQNLSAEQLSLAFGEWCQCNDHQHLREWLLEEERPTRSRNHDDAARQRLVDEIERLEAMRKQASVRAENCRRQFRDTELLRRERQPVASEYRGRAEQEILRELDLVLGDLRESDAYRRTQMELDEVRRRLASLPVEPTSNRGQFQDTVNRHIVGLMGNKRLNRRVNALYTQRRYDSFDGIVVEQPATHAEYDVPDAVVRIAIRIAIVEGLTARGEPVSLVMDEVLDGLSTDLQQTAVSYLANVAAKNQQVVILTGDERIVSMVNHQGGYTTYLHATNLSPTIDVNRQLTAYANDHEADKWYQPFVEPNRTRTTTRSEYYLRDQSLIEDLPAIDPSAAARCRAVGVDRIGDLIDVDPHWLAEQVRLETVTSGTVANWQALASLLCSVRNLRPFDARVLVGAGVRSSRQLSEMHPSRLLERVENFLTTERGRSILRSGSSYELSRITSWIAAAKNSNGRYARSSFDEDARDGYVSTRSQTGASLRNGVAGRHSESRDYDQEGYSEGTQRSSISRTSRSGSSRRGSRRSSRSGSLNGSSRNGSSGNGRSVTRRSRTTYPVVDREGRERTWERREYDPRQREPRTLRTRTEHESTTNENGNSSPVRLKFYLELASPVVDAPSIGPRMAARLEKFGILTVDQLLAANPESLADKLNHRRVDAGTIRAWQDQARLVCRIPNLRGHDAQMLVACEMTSPEELASMSAESVLSQVLAFARTVEGQRILRGSKEPDLAEVNDWIAWAASCRSIHAA